MRWRPIKGSQDNTSRASHKKIRIIKHEVVPDCGSYEVRFPDGRFKHGGYQQENPGLRPGFSVFISR